MTDAPVSWLEDPPQVGRQLQSTLRRDGTTELAIREVAIRPPADHEVVVRVQAAPINPSDIGVMWPAGQRSGFQRNGRTLIAPASPVIEAHTCRVDIGIAPGNEGAGEVIACGASLEASALLGRLVALRAGAGSFGDYVTVAADQCLAMNAGTTPERAASCFVNPLTAVGILTTARRLGQRALIHTAAASSLGLMLNRLARADGLEIVNVVRRPEACELLRAEGAQHVVDSSSPTFRNDLIAAVASTGATLAFDAIGGGQTAGDLLDAIETAQRLGAEYRRYGSNVDKRVFVYGSLDPSPTVIHRTFGLTHRHHHPRRPPRSRPRRAVLPHGHRHEVRRPPRSPQLEGETHT